VFLNKKYTKWGEPIVNNQTAPSLEAIAGIESLGQADNVEVSTTTAQTGKDFYAIYSVTESVISAIFIKSSNRRNQRL
jgi:hypothetical protein